MKRLRLNPSMLKLLGSGGLPVWTRYHHGPMRLPYKSSNENRKGISARDPHKTSRTGPATAVIAALCTSNLRSFRVCPLERSLLVMEGNCPQLNSMPASLEEVRIDGLPSCAYYIADFISKEEEQVLLDKVVFRCWNLVHANWQRLRHPPNRDGNSFRAEDCRLGRLIFIKTLYLALHCQNG